MLMPIREIVEAAEALTETFSAWRTIAAAADIVAELGDAPGCLLER